MKANSQVQSPCTSGCTAAAQCRMFHVLIPVGRHPTVSFTSGRPHCRSIAVHCECMSRSNYAHLNGGCSHSCTHSVRSTAIRINLRYLRGLDMPSWAPSRGVSVREVTGVGFSEKWQISPCDTGGIRSCSYTISDACLLQGRKLSRSLCTVDEMDLERWL